MFKISTKGDYGLLFLSALAEKASKGRKFVSLNEIAKEKRLSLPYLSQIALPLREAGLIFSKEGKSGGYCLAKPANKITIMKILEALEGPVEPVKCCKLKSASCECESVCAMKSTWMDAKKILADFLKKKTLADTIKF